MKLNQDCIRDLLLYLEENLSLGKNLKINTLKLKDYSQDDLLYTAQKLEEANYIKCKNTIYVGSYKPCIDVVCITYFGHQFLDTIRDNSVWSKTKNILSCFKSVSIEIISETASKVITNLINQKLGNI